MTNWKLYFDQTKNIPPRPLLVKALELVGPDSKEALELGSGAGNDTRYLLAKSFNVTAVDVTPAAENSLSDLPLEHVTFVRSSFENFEYPPDHYDLINAQFSLPFINPSQFRETFKSIISSLKPSGVICGQLFGVSDSWNTSSTKLTFQTEQEARDLLSSLQILTFKEQEYDGKTASGEMKHWHLFHFIAKREM